MIVSKILRKVLCHYASWFLPKACKGQKIIYLTFDDGPHSKFTIELLDLLQVHNVKVTFFCIGNNIIDNPETTERIVRDGHCLSNHTFSHKLYFTNSIAEACNEIVNCQKQIIKYQNSVIRLFRPPGGLMKVRDYILLRKMKYKIILWDVDSLDAKETNIQLIADRLINIVNKTSVILFHDDSSVCVNVLKLLLPYWIESGFKFGKLCNETSHNE